MTGNLGIFDLVILGLTAFFLLFSFINGMRRGLIRSFIRLLIVALCAVASLFAAQPVATYLMTMDLTQFNIVIEGEVLTGSLQDMILALLNGTPEIADILNMAPTLKELILQVPVVVIAIVVFILLFWVLKILSIIPYCIIKIFIPKRNADGTKKRKHRFCGFFVSIFQTVVVMSVFLIPTVGVIDTLDKLAPTIDTLMEVEEGSDESFTKMISEITDKSMVYPILEQYGIKDFYLTCFNKLANINLGSSNASLFEEVAKIADLAASMNNLTNENGDLSVGGFTDMLNKATESEVVMQTLSDILITNATALSNGETITFGETSFSIEEMVDDDDAQEMLKDFLGAFTEENEENVKAGVVAISAALNAAAEYTATHHSVDEDGNVKDTDSFETVVEDLGQAQERFLDAIEAGEAPDPDDEQLMLDVYGAFYDTEEFRELIPEKIKEKIEERRN